MFKQVYAYAKVIDGNMINCVVPHEYKEIQFFVNNRFLEVWKLNFAITSQEQLDKYVESAMEEWNKIA